MHWDGSKWSDVLFPRADSGFYIHGLAVISSSDIWAVGDTSDYPVKPVTAHWDGRSWTLIDIAGFQRPYGSLRAIAGLASNDIWAVGYFRDPIAGKDQNLLEHWDGVGWSEAAIPNVGRALNQLYNLAPDLTGGLWAVGHSYPTDFSKPISTLVVRGTP